MKTAINWLLDELKNLSESQLQHKDFQLYMQKQDIIINNAKEKEKEQIINAYDRGYKACDLDETLEINKTEFSGDRYYDITYGE